MLRIAQLSDLHFSDITFSPSQFLSKRWLGNLNLIFTRRKAHQYEQLDQLKTLLTELKVDLVIVTGDISTTSKHLEFVLAKEFFNDLEHKNIQLLFIPGNHDLYTKNAYKNKTFYRYFPNKGLPSLFSEYSLKKDEIEIFELAKDLCCICLDTVIPTHLFSSQGFFNEKLEKRLLHVLKQIPKTTSIILINHFPFFSNESPRKDLIRREALKTICEEHSNIVLFLHGHTHRQTVADLRPKLPIILDSGSTSHVNRGTFHLLTLNTNLNVDVYQWKDNRSWVKKEEFKCSLERR